VLGTAQPGRDFVTVRYSGAGDATGRTRVITATHCTRRGFRRIRRGDVALVLFAGCTYRRAALAAQRAGAAAVLFEAGPQQWPLRGTMDRAGVGIPTLAVRSRVLARLASRRGSVRVRVDGATTERVADNVIAELPGDERVVMAGGHLDSVPEGPGLNDNGSGVALLLALADRLPAAPRRATVRLGFWTAEEYGLYGSERYVADLPVAERRRIDAYLNFDMVGSPEAVPEIYDGSRRLERLLRRELPRAKAVSFDGASDHTPFQNAGVPVGGIYTGGLEPARRGRGLRDRCYHRRCDASGNVDLGVLARMASIAERVVGRLVR
jgi:Iap family predicted aminopeptidase